MSNYLGPNDNFNNTQNLKGNLENTILDKYQNVSLRQHQPPPRQDLIQFQRPSSSTSSNYNINTGLNTQNISTNHLSN